MRHKEILEAFNDEGTEHDEIALWRNIESNCSSAINNLKKHIRIFKGAKEKTQRTMLIDPKKYTRKSANTKNYYTMIMDNLSVWKKYPKRSNSLICTTDNYKAGLYGNKYLVLPFNDANIGICPGPDIWDSFGFNHIPLFHASLIPASDSDFTKFVEDFFIYKDNIVGKNRDFKPHSEYADMFEQVNTPAELIQVLTELYNPTDYGFKLTTVEHLPVLGANEIWTDAKCYLIPISKFSKLFMALNKEYGILP